MIFRPTYIVLNKVIEFLGKKRQLIVLVLTQVIKFSKFGILMHLEWFFNTLVTFDTVRRRTPRAAS